MPHTSPRWLYHFIFHQYCMSIPEIPYFCQHLVLSVFLILAVLAIVNTVVSHCGFNLYFPYDKWCKSLIGNLYIFLPMFLLGCLSFKISLREFFAYYIPSLTEFYVTNIFSQCVDYLFIFFINCVSSWIQRSDFDKVKCILFVLFWLMLFVS